MGGGEMDADKLDRLIDDLRAMAVQASTGRWLRYADVVVWLARLVETNGVLVRPIERPSIGQNKPGDDLRDCVRRRLG